MHDVWGCSLSAFHLQQVIVTTTMHACLHDSSHPFSRLPEYQYSIYYDEKGRIFSVKSASIDFSAMTISSPVTVRQDAQCTSRMGMK